MFVLPNLLLFTPQNPPTGHSMSVLEPSKASSKGPSHIFILFCWHLNVCSISFLTEVGLQRRRPQSQLPRSGATWMTIYDSRRRMVDTVFRVSKAAEAVLLGLCMVPQSQSPCDTLVCVRNLSNPSSWDKKSG